ncbi:MAG: aspartate ammonia-lyase [bacterium]|nr:aspartate ammonia-lyase [bacterium]
MRIEKDFLGKKEIPDNSLYGINSVRATENFPDQTSFFKSWYKAVGITKLACYLTYKEFKKAVIKNFTSDKIPITFFSDEIIESLISGAEEVSEGKYFEHFIIPAIQGGAGTSINMNINEIIANVSLNKLGKPLGEYNFISPFEHANIYQSTNDVVPTALKIAVLKLLNELEEAINKLRFKTEELERKYRHNIRVAYTQMQEAVPSSYGLLFGTYNEALSRDWWRVSKCFERIKVVNIGGSAVGTSLGVPGYFVMETVRKLQQLTKLPITGSENLSDATNNLDSFVEIHGILKSHAVNLEKMVSDIRLLSSDLILRRDIEIPAKQTGSSIMPGKVNPVIPEYIISSCHKIYSNDMLITSLVSQGMLDLNAYIPTIGHAIIESLNLLISANNTLKANLIEGISVNTNTAKEKLFNSPVITTALNPYIGYKKALLLAEEMKKSNVNVFEANTKLNLINEERLKVILNPENLLKAGFSVKDLLT